MIGVSPKCCFSAGNISRVWRTLLHGEKLTCFSTAFFCVRCCLPSNYLRFQQLYKDPPSRSQAREKRNHTGLHVLQTELIYCASRNNYQLYPECRILLVVCTKC
uniref:Predicted protein n=1 Tax=Hordeum vulgare subsp. vulgare TaxID=112509 RepID=F2DUA7_HORVV|nr:predicted protein [Hordeum vulgare subsp. vulgare]